MLYVFFIMHPVYSLQQLEGQEIFSWFELKKRVVLFLFRHRRHGRSPGDRAFPMGARSPSFRNADDGQFLIAVAANQLKWLSSVMILNDGKGSLARTRVASAKSISGAYFFNGAANAFLLLHVQRKMVVANDFGGDFCSSRSNDWLR